MKTADRRGDTEFAKEIADEIDRALASAEFATTMTERYLDELDAAAEEAGLFADAQWQAWRENRRARRARRAAP
ncbi:MAG TPA: hypothetical protein VI006_26800 [Solirubrobacteraceae bacterium]